MTLPLLLTLPMLLLAAGVYAVIVARSPACSRQIYGVALAVSTVALMAALAYLFSGQAPETLRLPIGLPWLGAHFRLDPLAAFFLIVVNLGSAVASLFALGYGQHEKAPERVLPFYPA
nr:hydrogenase 4 subunit B [Candidatus Contendobacter sp.]